MFKRGFDIIASTIGLTILSPVIVLLAVGIKLTSRGPIFYKAKRVGRHGVSFELLKFRSMVTDADKIGPGVTGANDVRITSVGHFLRQTKLDELPQLINVLHGDMSIVGPRPEDPRYVALYTEEQLQVLEVRPGITSPASIQYRDEAAILTGDDWETTYVEEIMPAKLAIDLEYARNPGLLLDIGLIFGTLRVLLLRDRDPAV